MLNFFVDYYLSMAFLGIILFWHYWLTGTYLCRFYYFLYRKLLVNKARPPTYASSLVHQASH